MFVLSCNLTHVWHSVKTNINEIKLHVHYFHVCPSLLLKEIYNTAEEIQTPPLTLNEKLDEEAKAECK